MSVPASSENEKGPGVVGERSSKTTHQSDKTTGNGKPAWLSSAPAATPSKPVVIPTRTRNGGARRSKETTAKSRRTSETGVGHDPHSVPSSVAALLAMTSVPRPKRQSPIPEGHRSRYASRTEDVEGARHELPRHPMSTSSPKSWNLLLSPPNELDPEYSSLGSDATLDAGSFVRSLSTESMPSLDEDYESSASPSSSVPSTPGFSVRSRNGHERRAKELPSSKVEDCVHNHPLLPSSSTDERVIDDFPEVPVTSRRGPSRSTSALKSNLSASIALIRSAARSFSNFTAPAISRDEYLTRSLLSINPPFTDERRPLPTQDPPDPALRRYLNPTTVSPSELHIHPDHPRLPTDRDRCTASIQLQSYKRVSQPSANASAPPVFALSEEEADAAIAAAAEEPFSTPSPRQREPRENSDFLRVIVLEMNMRRSGQLGDQAPGKARISLPARQASKKEEAGEGKGEAIERGVPRRWIAVDAY